MRSYAIIIRSLPLMVVSFILISCNSDKDIADAYGNFEATEVIVSAKSQGELLYLNLKQGDYIHQGDSIGGIDQEAVEIKRRQLQAQQGVTLARKISLDAQLKVQDEQRSMLARELNRLEKLLAENAATPQQVDDLTGKLQVLDAQTASVKTQYRLISAEIEVLKAQLDEVDHMLDQCIIVNPLDGTVLEKYAEPGELVIPGKSLYKVADLKNMELKVYVSGAQLSGIALGDSVKVRFDNQEKDYAYLPGSIDWISAEVEFTPKIIQTKEERVNMVYAVKIGINNDGRIKIGMPGEVIFDTSNKPL